jgi:hypothetical protein
MKRAVCFLVGGLCLGGAATASPNQRMAGVAAEIHREVAAVQEAISESTSQDKNLNEICFRVGNLYTTLRYELEEIAGDQPAKEVKALIADGKSLPSFCGDKEKAKADPGYEAVPRGDIARLKVELGNVDRRAAVLSAR